MPTELPGTGFQKLQAERQRLLREVRQWKAWLLLMMLLCSVLYFAAVYWIAAQERHMKDTKEKAAPVNGEPVGQPRRRFRLELLEPREAPNVVWGDVRVK